MTAKSTRPSPVLGLVRSEEATSERTLAVRDEFVPEVSCAAGSDAKLLEALADLLFADLKRHS